MSNKKKMNRDPSSEKVKKLKLGRETIKDLAAPPSKGRDIKGGVYSVAWTYRCGN